MGESSTNKHPVSKIVNQVSSKLPSRNKKDKKEKCHKCNKKLLLIHFTCKCNNKFCIKHQSAHSHNCSYDIKKEKKDEIKKNNPKIESKMVKI